MTSLKSIAIRPTRRTGKSKSPSSSVEELDVSSGAGLRREPRRMKAAPQHLYRVGEKLYMRSGGYSSTRPASGCKVTSLLPYEGSGALLYRVQGDTETFQRVVGESELSRS